jgi:chemotaxis protein MotB
MVRKKNPGESAGGAPEWMCTFSDMMSLLLCFFILLFALSTLEEKQFVQLAGSFQAGFGGMVAPYTIQNIRSTHLQPEKMSKSEQDAKKKAYGKDKVLTRMKQLYQSLKLDDTIAIKGTEKGIQFTVIGDALFDRNSALIKPQALTFLQQIGENLRDMPDNPIKFSGHCDTGPPPPKKLYADKWQLSMERARALMVYFRDFEWIDPARMSYEGFADTLPATDEKGRVISTDTEEGQAQHRRVEITLIQTDENAPWYMIDREEEAAPTPVPELEPI